jgi:hypothetical protein
MKGGGEPLVWQASLFEKLTRRHGGGRGCCTIHRASLNRA